MRQRLSALGFISCTAALMACVGANAATLSEAASITEQMANTAVIYSNTEEIYFDAEAGKEAAPKLTISVNSGKVTYLDDYDVPIPAPVGVSVVKMAPDIVILNTGKRTTELRRGNPIKCWASVRKNKAKPGGKDDWHFVGELKSHDQGGRIRIGGGESGTPAAMFRMRTVYWPQPSTSRPSKVLYIHTAEDPERAVSYSWANIDASRVGVNLRWIQVSCTIEGAERGSQVSKDTFRG